MMEVVFISKKDFVEDVSEKTKQDIQAQLKRITAFASLQKEHIKGFECTDDIGVTYGQRVVPVDCVGCYVPGGRYSHISSSIMTIATAKVAGVKTVVACSPPIGTILCSAFLLMFPWLKFKLKVKKCIKN